MPCPRCKCPFCRASLAAASVTVLTWEGPVYSWEDVAKCAGVSGESVRRLRRTLGLPPLRCGRRSKAEGAPFLFQTAIQAHTWYWTAGRHVE